MPDQCRTNRVMLGLNNEATKTTHLSEQGGVVVTLLTYIGNVVGSNFDRDAGSAI